MSIAIAAVFFGIAVVMGIQIPNDLSAWAYFGIWAGYFAVFTLVVAVWARTLGRAVAALFTGLLLFGLQRLLQLPYVAEWDSFAQLDWYHTAADWLITASLFAGFIFTWTVARRRTAFTVIGVIPVAGWLALATWLYDNEVSFDYSTTAGVLAYNATELGIAVVGILLFWAFDGLGLLMRRGRARPAPADAGPAPASQYPRPPQYSPDVRSNPAGHHRPPGANAAPYGSPPPPPPAAPGAYQPTQIRPTGPGQAPYPQHPPQAYPQAQPPAPPYPPPNQSP